MADRNTTEDDKATNRRHYLIAGAVGITAGLLVAAVTIRKEFFEDISKIPELRAEFDKLSTNLQGHWNDLKGLSPAEMDQKRSGYFKWIADQKLLGHNKIRDILEEHGYRSHGWTGITLGTLDRTRQMSRDSTTAIVMNSSVTMGVVFGALLNYFNGLHVRRKLDDAGHIPEKLDELRARIDDHINAKASVAHSQNA